MTCWIPKLQTEAEILGKAMRFGAMLWMHTESDIGEFIWKPKKHHLELNLLQHSAPLFGEVAEARLISLANSLGCALSVRVGSDVRDLTPS